jgi:alanine racemase
MAGITKPIMAMSYCDDSFDRAFLLDIEPSLATHEELVACAAAAARGGRVVRVHIKVDTGLVRRGVAWQDVGEFYAQCAAFPLVHVVSIFTHCADSSPEDPTFMYEQKRRYDHAILVARQRGFAGATHMASSGSLTLIHEYDMVRVGTMLYGSWKNDVQKKRVREVVADAALIPPLTLSASIIEQQSNIIHIGIGWRHAFWMRPGIRVRASCGCDGVVIQVDVLSSSAHTACTHTGERIVAVCGPYPGIMPTDIAVLQGTIANEITTRISPLVARDYASR